MLATGEVLLVVAAAAATPPKSAAMLAFASLQVWMAKAQATLAAELLMTSDVTADMTVGMTVGMVDSVTAALAMGYTVVSQAAAEGARAAAARAAEVAVRSGQGAVGGSRRREARRAVTGRRAHAEADRRRPVAP